MTENPSENPNRGSEEDENAPIIYKVKAKIARIQINTKMNTINISTAKLLLKYLVEAEANPKARVIIIKSTGDRIFSAGFDLKMFQNGFSDELQDNLLGYGGAISRMIFFSKKPVIAQIQGSAIGAGSIISLACDFRFVANKPDLYFALPEIDLNIFPATGPTAMAIHTLGLVHAKEMLITGRKIPLEEFNRWGGVTRICEPENLEKETRKFAKKLAEKNPNLLHLIKPTMNLMGYNQAKSWFDLEDEMGRYFMNGVMEKEVMSADDKIREIWEKYGKGVCSYPDLS